MLATVHQPLSHSAALAVLADQLATLDAQLQEELAHCGVLTVKLDREVELWIGVDQRTHPGASSTSTKVLVVLEPPDVRQFCLQGFDHVLTWQQEHLQSLPNAHFLVPATPWLLPTEWLQFHGGAKKCGLGFLRGAKTKTEGHRLRHDVWAKRSELEVGMRIPLDFTAGGVDREARNRQFCNQFVLVIENSRHPNYFTEKLLDALVGHCVPVYWGCPNLGDFFDLSGVIVVPQGGAAAAIAACLQLTEAEYTSRAKAVERNCELATQYAGDFGQRLQHAVQKCLPPLAGLTAKDAGPST